MNCTGDDCRRMYCNGTITRQRRINGEETFICNSCGKEYTQRGSSKT